jgi:predicted TIM-barrel fold metal-dependent hydrolase
MFYGYSREGLMSCEANPFDFFDDLPDNIDDYTKKMREYIKESYEMGKCAAIKVCMAYFRDIAFEKVEKDKANQVYSNLHNPEYIKFFQDYVMDMICIIAEEFSIPVQIHTGLGQIYGTSPIDIMPMIKRHDRVKFSLLHGGFPWTDDLLAVLYHCSNTYLDICWMPLLSTKIAVETVISALELIGSERIIWGCDAATVEESYGALLATFEILDEVEESFIKRKFFGREEAQILREKILYSNAKELFG